MTIAFAPGSMEMSNNSKVDDVNYIDENTVLYGSLCN